MVQERILAMKKELTDKLDEVRNSIQSVVHRAEGVDEVAKYKLD